MSLLLLHKSVQEYRGRTVGGWRIRVAVTLGFAAFVFVCLSVLFELE
ncbi:MULTISPECIES: hypothetical protein [unclassified Nocardiopsis]|nr:MULTISPECIES: hypothetical protein [unclassified Nocardiopsis]